MTEEERWEEQEERLETALKPRLTPDVLATLKEAARVYGWTGDYYEIGSFVQWAHEVAGAERPQEADLEPYLSC